MSDDVTTNDNGASDPSGRPRHRFSSWSLVIASLLFSAATFEMLVLYGIVHWQIMFRADLPAERPPYAVFTVLGHLFRLRVLFSVLALVWALWSFRACPKWAAITALVVSLVAMMTMAIVM